jgi:hypothetical protein
MKKLIPITSLALLMTVALATPALADQWYTVELECSSHVGLKFIENVQAPDIKSADEKALSILTERPMKPSGCRIKKTTAQ